MPRSRKRSSLYSAVARPDQVIFSLTYTRIVYTVACAHHRHILSPSEPSPIISLIVPTSDWRPFVSLPCLLSLRLIEAPVVTINLYHLRALHQEPGARQDLVGAHGDQLKTSESPRLRSERARRAPRQWNTYKVWQRSCHIQHQHLCLTRHSRNRRQVRGYPSSEDAYG